MKRLSAVACLAIGLPFVGSLPCEAQNDAVSPKATASKPTLIGVRVEAEGRGKGQGMWAQVVPHPGAEGATEGTMISSNLLLSFLLLVGVTVGQNKPSRPAAKPETPHLVFVQEYIRELMSDESLRASAEKEFHEAKSDDQRFSTGIYVSKSVQLELRSQIRMLQGMRLRPPFDTLIPSLIGSYQRQIDLHQSLIDASSKFLGGPKPGVDYSALGAKVPQLRAELEAAQKPIFDAAGLVFMTLIDTKPDSQGHVSHLLITKAEKSDLQKQLEIMLKDQPDEGDHDFYISAAMVLRAGFLKGHKCADEPWE